MNRYIFNEQELQKQIGLFKLQRAGNLIKRINDRINQTAEYLINGNIKTVVLGLSGGIDSALCLAILHRVKVTLIPDLKIVGVHFKRGSGTPFIYDLGQQFTDVKYEEVNLSTMVDDMVYELEIPANKWYKFSPQIEYALMYTALFGIAQREEGITVGSANLDELGFVGWFGKNSDMVTDIQLIHDFHKFEVKYFAKYLNVPHSIVSRIPTGDIPSGETDEEVFECSYDELSFITHLVLNEPENINQFIRTRFKRLFELHEINKHKYQGQTFNPVFIGK